MISEKLLELSFIPLNYYIFTTVSNFLTCVFLFIFVLVKNHRSGLNKTFSAFCFAIAHWSLFYSLFLWTKDARLADFYIRTCMIGVIFIPSTFTHFVTVLLDIKKNKVLIILNYLVSLCIVAMVYTPFYAKSGGSFLVFPYWPLAGIIFPVHLAHFLINLLYSYPLIFRALKEYRGFLREQVRYVLLGTGIGFLGGLTNYFAWYRIEISPFLNISASLGVPIISYAIIKHRLMNINVAATRVGLFVFVYALVLGIPFWLGYSMKSWFPPTLLAIILATAGPFIYNYIRKRAEDIILQEQKRYQKAIANLGKDIIAIRILDKLFNVITSAIVQEVKVSFSAVYLKADDYKSFQLKSAYPLEAKSRFPELIPYDDALITALNKKSEPLSSEEAGNPAKINFTSGLAIPCFGKDGLLAILFLGPKPDNLAYTDDDILAFQNFSYAISFAIESCIYWKEMENYQRMARIEEMHSFSYSVAHEIDNPMTIIIRGIDVLIRDYIGQVDDEADKKRLVDLLNFMHEAAWRVSGMVKAVQEFGQKASSELKPIKFEKVIDTFLNLYLPHFKMNGVVFTKEVPKEPYPLIRGISQEIEQTLLILAKNAVQALQFTKEKKIHLKAEIINSDWIRITLTDNGPGIAKEKLLSIFTAFYTTKGTNEGTGMGLFNATKFIVERHKGKLWAESEGPGKGASFIIELPIAKDIQPEELKEERKSNITKFN